MTDTHFPDAGILDEVRDWGLKTMETMMTYEEHDDKAGKSFREMLNGLKTFARVYETASEQHGERGNVEMDVN